MRFDSELKPAPYLNRKDQKRLLMMVGLLCMIFVASIWAARPETWYWLIPPDNDSATNQPAAPQKLRIDSADNADSEQNLNSEKEQQNETNTITNPTDLPTEWLSSINDHAIGLQVAEAEAYYRTLAHISRLDDRFIKKNASQDIVYVNLLRDPDQYRGKLISITGTARRISKMEAGENEFGVKQTYVAWVFTADSGSDPLRIVATNIDSRLPVGENVSVDIKVTGYFLKLFGYASNGGQHLAPLLIAQEIEPYIVHQSNSPDSTGLEPYIILFATVTGLGTILMGLLYAWGDRKFQKKLKTDYPSHPSPPDQFFDQLQKTETKNNLFS